MKPGHTKRLFIEIVAALYVLLYLHTAISKLKDISFFIGSISHTPFIRPYANFLAGFIPGVEIAISVALIIPSSRYIGLMMATGLMALFTTYVSYIMITMEELPCSCGGVIQRLNWKGHLLLNISFLVAGIFSIWYHKQLIAITRRSRTPVT